MSPSGLLLRRQQVRRGFTLPILKLSEKLIAKNEAISGTGLSYRLPHLQALLS